MYEKTAKTVTILIPHNNSGKRTHTHTHTHAQTHTPNPIKRAIFQRETE